MLSFAMRLVLDFMVLRILLEVICLMTDLNHFRHLLFWGKSGDNGDAAFTFP